MRWARGWRRAANAPATNFDADNQSQNVYFAGPDGSLREIAWTRLVWVKVGRTPPHAAFSITCRGRGCPARKLHATSATLRRHHRRVSGKTYRAGDRLLISLSAPSWKPERARITIRNGRAPSVQLL